MSRRRASSYPAWAEKSVHLKRPAAAGDFALKHAGPNSTSGRTSSASWKTRRRRVDLVVEVQSELGEVKLDPKRDLAKLALIQRHKGKGGMTVGLVSGFGFNVKCAVASTVAHDCHQMLVVGTDETDMAVAANELARSGGGQVVVRDGRVLGMVELSIAGLMSTEKVEVVARKAESVLAGFRACGCTLHNPNMQLSLLALPTIPELRISDKGLVDV